MTEATCRGLLRAGLALSTVALMPLAAVSCTGAARPEEAVASQPSGTTETLAPFATLERLPADGGLAARDLLPGPEIGREEEWIAIDGQLAPNPFWVRSAAGDGEFAASRVRTRTADLKVMEWSVADDGSVLLHAVDSLPDRTTSIFEPALLIAPPTLAPGEERASESPMRAVLTANPARERDRGRGVRTIRYDRDERVLWRGAEHRAQVAVVRFVADLGSARAERVTEIWVIPGEGAVAERWDETLTILRVFEKRSKQYASRR